MLEYLHTLPLLSAREHYTEFCSRESFKDSDLEPRLGTQLVAKTSSHRRRHHHHHHLLQHKLLPADMNVTVGTIRSPEQLNSRFDSKSSQLQVSTPGTAKTSFFASPKAPDWL
jgi:hypothetical protein